MPVSFMVTSSTQKVCKECVEKMEKMKLFSIRKSSFDKALRVLLSFCENDKKEFEKWRKKNLK